MTATIVGSKRDVVVVVPVFCGWLKVARYLVLPI